MIPERRLLAVVQLGNDCRRRKSSGCCATKSYLVATCLLQQEHLRRITCIVTGFLRPHSIEIALPSVVAVAHRLCVQGGKRYALCSYGMVTAQSILTPTHRLRKRSTDLSCHPPITFFQLRPHLHTQPPPPKTGLFTVCNRSESSSRIRIHFWPRLATHL